MDFGGIMGFDGLMGYSSEPTSSNFSSSQKGLCLKHLRSDVPQDHHNQVEGDHSFGFKVAKIDGEQMLSFCSSKPNDEYLSFYHQHHYQLSPSHFHTNAGMGIGSTNVSMHGLRGPFTPSQWVELEHQALIYRYINAKAPIPSNLLIPFRRSINSSGFTYYLPGSFRSSALGWGSFHMGLSGSADPEPGRCRRTDGKKWRCSRDAVSDQKYCERHINRGRYRSRKLVEGRSGHASKSMPAIATSATSGISIAQQQSKSLQANCMDPPPSTFDRYLMGEEKTNGQNKDSQPRPALKDSQPRLALTSNFGHNDPFGGGSSGVDFGLSISIPANQGNLSFSPLRLSREFDVINEEETQNHRQTSWIPISWEPTVGGPLGEVLNNTNSTLKGLSKNSSSSSLNILTDGWDSSPRFQASPTGVLQKTTIGSLSSSAGSSPRAGNLCEDLLGPTVSSL